MSQTMQYVFDATQHEPDAGLDAIPAGLYSFAIDGVEIVDIANDGATRGQQVKITAVVTDGEYKGRKVITHYGLWNKTSPEAVRISHSQFSALCHVTNIFKVDFSSGGKNLIGGQFRARVDNDGKYNAVKEVFDLAGNKPGRSGGAVPTTAPVATATPGGNWGGNAPAAPAAAAPPAAPAFPPAGWTAHPTAPGFFYQGSEVLSEADLRAKTAAPAAPATPAAPNSAFAGGQPAPAAAQPPAPQGWNQAAPSPAAPSGAAPTPPWGQPAAA